MVSDSIFWTLQKRSQLPDGDFWLSAVEKERLSQLRFPKRRQEWLLGRWTAKTLLSSMAMQQLSIENESSGAPFVTYKGIRLDGMLSISHRNDLAVAAWTVQPDLKIGIDLEKIEPKNDAFVNDFFTADEAEMVFRQEPMQQGLAASLIWSAKEAILKALQTGLHLDTRQVEVACENLTPPNDWQELSIKHCPSSAALQQLYWLCHSSYIVTLAMLSG